MSGKWQKQRMPAGEIRPGMRLGDQLVVSATRDSEWVAFVLRERTGAEHTPMIRARAPMDVMVPAPETMTETRPAHRVRACDVFAGMLWPIATGRDGQSVWATIERVDSFVDGCRVEIGNGGSHIYHADGAVYRVQLPGPSPRKLCTCLVPSETETGYVEAVPPHEHAADCPVAPVPGRHGGMRLWPAPYKGKAWTWDKAGEEWRCDHWRVWAHWLTPESQSWLPYGTHDVLLQCFYLQPEPQPEHREPTPWDPWSGYYDEAVTHG